MPKQSTDTLTMNQLHAALAARGVHVARTQLSGVLNLDPVPELLNLQWRNRRRVIPLSTLDTLARFIPYFQAKRIRWNMFPEALHDWLDLGGPTDREIDVDRIAFIAGLAQSEAVLTDEQAAAFLQTDVEHLRAEFPVTYRIGDDPSGDRWLRSQIVRRLQRGNV